MLEYDPDLEEYLKVAEAPMSGAGSSAGEVYGGEEEGDEDEESDLDLEGYFNQLQADGSDEEDEGGEEGEGGGGGEDEEDEDDVQDLDDALAELLKGDDD